MNIVKEWDLSPIGKGTFRWPAVDKEMPDDDFFTKAKLLTWKTCVCVM